MCDHYCKVHVVSKIMWSAKSIALCEVLSEQVTKDGLLCTENPKVSVEPGVNSVEPGMHSTTGYSVIYYSNIQ